MTRKQSNIKWNELLRYNNVHHNLSELPEINFNTLNKTDARHSIYLYLSVHGNLNIDKPNAIIPSPNMNISQILRGVISCENIGENIDCFTEMSYKLFKGLFSNGKKTLNLNDVSERVEELNNGLSPKEWYDIYKKYYMHLDNLHRQYLKQLFLNNKNSENLVEVPKTKKFKGSLQDDMFDMYIYDEHGGGNIIEKELTYNIDKPGCRKGIVCLYSSGGIYGSYRNLNELFNNKNNTLTITMSELLDKLNKLGYKNIYIIDDSCNSYVNNKENSNAESNSEFPSFNDVKHNRNQRLASNAFSRRPNTVSQRRRLRMPLKFSSNFLNNNIPPVVLSSSTAKQMATLNSNNEIVIQTMHPKTNIKPASKKTKKPKKTRR